METRKLGILDIVQYSKPLQSLGKDGKCNGMSKGLHKSNVDHKVALFRLLAVEWKWAILETFLEILRNALLAWILNAIV